MSPLAHIGMVSHNIPATGLYSDKKSLSLPTPKSVKAYKYWRVKKMLKPPLKAKSPQVGSIYTAMAISLERYLAVVHPFSKFR